MAKPVVAPDITNLIDASDANDTPVDELSQDMKELEERAHAHHVLLSSDAMRHFLAVCKDEVDRVTFLDRVIADARVTYPSEDGWVVLSLSRMHELCRAAKQRMHQSMETEAIELVQTPLGAGSLAEAIVAGDVNAAYRMIERRPMVALADAATDLDAVYRKKRGMEVSDDQVSQLLTTTVESLSTETLERVIKALTSAVDGTYNDEHAAVKIAIMKAVDIVQG